MRAAIGLLCGLAVLVPLSAGAAAPPPGATAQCRDGSYSFSQHRPGTCSHHGGVAVWLTGSTAPQPAASATPAATAGTVTVGRTVLLAPRLRASGCVLGANPDRACSPGAYYSGLTDAVICSAGFRTGTIRNVPDSERFAVEREYGLAPGHYGRTLEIDHIVSLELGGSNDIANLFPERADAHPGYHTKDALENRLHAMVCAGQLGLRATQLAIAANWQALYEKVFGTPPVG